MKPKGKKKVYDSISEKFKRNLEKIYNQVINKKVYFGSDIWRFFKNDVIDYCIEQNKGEDKYRNILVLITDGYIYHANSRDMKKNRSTYITPSFFKKTKLRSNNWKKKMETGDYGFITIRDDLQNLEILVLEINPDPFYIKDEDIIRAYLRKWFREMNVKKFALYNTDLPQYTKGRVDNFLTK